MEASDQFFDARHLRHPTRADKRPDGDFFQASFREHVEEPNLVGHCNIGALDLQTVAHALFGQNHFRVIAHTSLLQSEQKIKSFVNRPYTWPSAFRQKPWHPRARPDSHRDSGRAPFLMRITMASRSISPTIL